MTLGQCRLSSARSVGELDRPPGWVVECDVSQLPLIDVHERSALASGPVRESEALIEATSGQVRFIDADIHRLGTPTPGLSHRRLHECPSPSLSPSGGDDIELGEITLQPARPNCVAEAEDRQTLRFETGDEDGGVSLSEEASESLCQYFGRRRGFAELTVEVV
jgi:hypothetical protein